MNRKNIAEQLIAGVILLLISFFVFDMCLKPEFIPSISEKESPNGTDNAKPAVSDTPSVHNTKQPKSNGYDGNATKPPLPSVRKDVPSSKPILKEKEQDVQKRFVLVTLYTDAIFSDASIFANGVQVYPVENNLSIKELKIEYTNNTIKLEVKTNSKTCEKLISIPSDYFDKQSKISISCKQ